MSALRKTAWFLGLGLGVSGCDSLHSFVYNMTSCPIELRVWMSNVYDGNSFSIPPGEHFFVLGGLYSQYDHLEVRDGAGMNHVYLKSDLGALRPEPTWDDRWGYFEDGLRFVKTDIEKRETDRLAFARCPQDMP